MFITYIYKTWRVLFIFLQVEIDTDTETDFDHKRNIGYLLLTQHQMPVDMKGITQKFHTQLVLVGCCYKWRPLVCRYRFDFFPVAL